MTARHEQPDESADSPDSDLPTEFIERGAAISRSDELGLRELEDVARRYSARKRAFGALVVDDLIDLEAAYGIAEARAELDKSEKRKRSNIKNADHFSWHLRSVMGEFALPNHESDVVLQHRAFEARQLVVEFPEWLEPLRSGIVSLNHARTFLRDTRPLEAAQIALLSAQVLEYSKENTVSQTKKFVKREVAAVGAKNFEEAHKRAREERSITVEHDGLGMSTLYAYIPTELAVGIDKQLTLDARAIREANAIEAEAFKREAQVAEVEGQDSAGAHVADERTTAQIRADVFAEMLLCVTPESVVRAETSGASRARATVSIIVPVLSLLGGREDGSQPALIDGMMPMSFDEARQFAAEAPSLQRILTDPIKGHTTSVDTYLPNKSLRTFLRVRDVTCRFAGCTRPAIGSDLDHTNAYSEGGATSEWNLAHLCRGHHVQKHQRRWRMRQLGGGVIEWLTPLGYRRITEPEAIGPRFTPTDEYRGAPPPF